jgi:hypothetical protein
MLVRRRSLDSARVARATGDLLPRYCHLDSKGMPFFRRAACRPPPPARGAGSLRSNQQGWGPNRGKMLTRGHDIAAACGQLRLQTKQAEREAWLSV